MLSEGLHAYLAADAGVSGQLGLSTARPDGKDGIFPTLAPKQPAMPYIVYSQVTGKPMTESFQGTNALQTTRWRFSCYGTTPKNAKRLAKFVKQAMFSLNGSIAGQAFVEGSWFKFEADHAEEIPNGILFGTHVDFEVNYVDADVS